MTKPTPSSTPSPEPGLNDPFGFGSVVASVEEKFSDSIRVTYSTVTCGCVFQKRWVERFLLQMTLSEHCKKHSSLPLGGDLLSLFSTLPVRASECGETQ